MRSLKENQCINADGQPIPWYSYPAIEQQSRWNFSDCNILEYGCGNSTKWWVARSKSVTSIENSPAWFDKIDNLGDINNWPFSRDFVYHYRMIEANMRNGLKRKFDRLGGELDERGRRWWAASEALALGRGGIKAVAEATGMGERTIRRGCEEIRQEAPRKSPVDRRTRRSGGGRKPLSAIDPRLVAALEALMEPTLRGDPMSPLRWTCKSTRKLAKALAGEGHKVSHSKIAQLLADLGFSLQSTRKSLEGSSHPDRDAQFRYINRCVKVFQRAGQPAISVDAKKKELVGPYSNGGREYRPKGQPEQVRTHDFPDKQLARFVRMACTIRRAIKAGSVSGSITTPPNLRSNPSGVGGCIGGKEGYPLARAVLMTADGGGSNASRNRLWKVELQQLANEMGLAIYGRHFPPGASKWNKIEHRMFCHITENWRGRPLTSQEVIVN